MLPTDSLHLLTIDFELATANVRAAFAFSLEEQRELLLAAGSDEIPLVVLVGVRGLHLISTNRNHVPAFRPALARVRERTRTVEGWRALPVRVTRGPDAARQFLRHALPFAQPRTEADRFLGEMRLAADLSSRCHALSSELAALFQLTEEAAERIEVETRLGRAGSLEAELELEALAGERIVEEALLAWQSSYPAVRASVRPPLSEGDIELFAADEPRSMVRMRVARVLTKLRTA